MSKASSNPLRSTVFSIIILFLLTSACASGNQSPPTEATLSTPFPSSTEQVTAPPGETVGLFAPDATPTEILTHTPEQTASTDPNEPLFPAYAMSNGDMRAGYINQQGQFVIEPQFYFADPFVEGLAVVSSAEGRGFIDKSGAFIIQPQFQQASNFSEGLAAVQTLQSSWGYVDKNGVLVIEPQFEKAGEFHNGYAIVSLVGGGKTYIDQTGTPILDTGGYLTINEFDSGVASLSRSDGEKPVFGVVNTRGEFVIPFGYHFIYPYTEGLAAAAVSDKDLWGYLDPDGNFAIQPQYFQASEFSGGYASVKTSYGGKCGYIDQTGTLIIEAKYEQCSPFNDGLGIVEIGENLWGFIKPSGDILFEFPVRKINPFSDGMAKFFSDTGSTGYIDSSGNIAIPAQFQEAQDFEDGLAWVRVYSAAGVYEGYIDKTGTFVYRLDR